jgi:hypothetical protein
MTMPSTTTSSPQTKMLSRTDALYAAWMVEKGHINKKGWDFLRDSLQLPIGTPKAQIRSTLETFLAQGEVESKSGKDHWTYEASLDGQYDDSFGDSNLGDGFWCLFLNSEQSFICRESDSSFWDIYGEYDSQDDAKHAFEGLRNYYEGKNEENAD